MGRVRVRVMVKLPVICFAYRTDVAVALGVAVPVSAFVLGLASGEG